MTAVDLELSLRSAGSHFAVEARCDLPGSDVAPRASATVEIDLARLQALTLDPTAYGLALGQMVLVGDIATTFAKASAVAQDRGLPLRLRLALPADAADLHAIRWETLRDPAHPDTPLLTTGMQVLFSRYLSSIDWQPVALPLKESLRALVVLSSPTDLDAYGLHPLDLEAERGLAEASFGPIPITVLGRGQASLNEITQHLCEGYSILYLLAHGRTDDTGETWMYLEGIDGQTEAIPGSALVTRIVELREKHPRLIILGSCESAGELLTLGPRLAQAGIPAVLAMQGWITLETLRSFLSECLRELQREGLIDQAVAVARGTARERPDFWVPVLFLRSQSGRLWRISRTANQQEKVDPQPMQITNNAQNSGLQGIFNGPVINITSSLPFDSMPLPQALEQLATLPDGEGAPIPPPNSFATSPVPRLMLLTPNDLFVGRDAELRTMAGRLKAGNSVVITTGMGGVGKTQLAAELAHRYGRFFAGGVFWLDASSAERLEESIIACGQVLIRDPEFSKQPRDEQLRQVRVLWADPLPRLLIFDNCEEPELLHPHWPRASGCRLLITSRNAQWPEGQGFQVRPLDVLSPHNSVILLRSLASHQSEAEAAAIAEELGNLPLALHLAGSYLKRYASSVSPEAFLAGIKRRMLGHPALEGKGPGKPPTYDQQERREHGLRAVFEISLERLDLADPIDALARLLLARAAGLEPPGWAFPKVFLVQTAPVTEDVDPDLPLVEEALDRLLQLGLLEVTGEQRLRLHRLLAAFAWEALEGSRVLAAFAPIAFQWVAALITKINEQIVAEPLKVQRMLDQERPLWEQFLDWGYTHEQQIGMCVSARVTAQLNNYWSVRDTQSREITLNRLLRALAVARRLNDVEAQAELLYILGNSRLSRSEKDIARNNYNEALNLFLQIKNSLGEANTLYSMGDLYQFEENQELALASYDKALSLYRSMNEYLGEANTLHAIGVIQGFRLDFDKALSCFEMAIRLFDMTGDRLCKANTLHSIGEILMLKGDLEGALISYRQALELYQEAGSRRGKAHTLRALAEIHLLQNNLEATKAICKAALELYRDMEDKVGEANTLSIQSRSLLQEDVVYSQVTLERALALRQFTNDAYSEGMDLGRYGTALLHRRQYMEGLHYLQRARAIFAALGQEMQMQQIDQFIIQAQRDFITQLTEQPISLFHAIAAVAQSNDAPRAQVEAALAHLDAQGHHLTAPVRAIWAGQRDPAVLTDGLDDTDTALVQRILALLAEGEAGVGG